MTVSLFISSNAAIANDVAPTDFEGNPYTFYGYIKKALAYSITVFDEE